MPRNASYWYSLAKDISWKEKDTIVLHTSSKDLEVIKPTCRCSIFLISNLSDITICMNMPQAFV